MKRFFLLAAVAAATCFAACTKPDNNDPTPGPGPGPVTKEEISVSPASVSFEGEGGTLKVVVTSTSGEFFVHGNPDWLTVQKNGKEVSLTATANTVAEARSCSLTFTAGTASCSLAVSQKAGSPYAGFTVCTDATFEYAGIMLYQFLKPLEEDYGGQGYISMSDEDGNTLSIWVYTELFASEEEVELSAGLYEKGQDEFPVLYGKKYTYVVGSILAGEDDEEDTIMGSFFTDMAAGKQTSIVGGTVEVKANGDGTTDIIADMIDSEGTPCKFVFMGQVAIDKEGATYPSTGERIDVTSNIYAAYCYYMGDVYENGTSNYQLYLYSGEEEDYSVYTVFEFNAAGVEFSEDIDLSGEYYTIIEPEEGEDPCGPGTLIPGSLAEVVPGFEFPFGTYILYNMGDYLLADAFGSLVLEKQEDGKYTLTAALMSNAGDMVMFMGADFSGVHDLEILIYDGNDEEED